jgi:hypothetical protein
MIRLAPPTSWRRRGDLAIGGIPIGSFLGQTKSAQARRFGGFDSLVILIGEARFHMYMFCHLERISFWQLSVHRAGGVSDDDKMIIAQLRVCTLARSAQPEGNSSKV